MALNFEKEKLISELKKRNPKKVLVQLPEGVKQDAFEISEIFEKLGIEAIFSGETCWGGCSIAIHEAKELNADLIVHFGHAEYIKTEFPVIYIEIKDELDLEPLMEKSLENLKEFNKIGLCYSIQHRQDIEKIRKFYKNNEKEIILSKKSGVVAYEGHVLGCEYSGLKEIEKEVDCFLIIGNNFHAMGAALAVKKPVFLLDVYNDKITNMENVRDKVLKQRSVLIDKFRKAKKIGIITERKLGQRFGAAEFLIGKLKKKDKETIIITMNEITPDKIMNFYSVDCFVELACPRIAIDDFSKYEKPLITFREALVGLGEKSWDELLEEGIL